MKNYRKELDYYRSVYSQQKVDQVLNENKMLVNKLIQLEKTLCSYREKIKHYDFTTRILSKEIEEGGNWPFGF